MIRPQTVPFLLSCKPNLHNYMTGGLVTKRNVSLRQKGRYNGYASCFLPGLPEYFVSTCSGIQRFRLLFGLHEQSPKDIQKWVYSVTSSVRHFNRRSLFSDDTKQAFISGNWLSYLCYCPLFFL